MEDGQSYKIGFVIQARMGSKRLPKKILKNLPFNSKDTLIGNIIKRLKKSRYFSKIVVASSIEKENNELELYLNDEFSIECFRGDEYDVLSRFIEIQKKEKFDIIVRLTADNPCLDSKLLDEAIDNHIISKADYSYTKDYPLGMNFEVINGEEFLKIENEEKKVEEKEHVTLFFRNRPESYRLNYIENYEEKKLEELRLTVDTNEDYYLQCVLHDKFPNNIYFSLEDIVKLKKTEPWIFEINKKTKQKSNSSILKDEICDGIEVLIKYGYDRASDLLRNQLNDF
ncbi:MAG: hypothetical protein QMC34_01080 [Flavobacteriales bacterium]|jgi:spore coat polysaccharide biosynthesis protein SpsF|tara:strand:+ start:497 stop:1348 length:852 start_codon:yes stop_codon:yes gene_type:complete